MVMRLEPNLLHCDVKLCVHVCLNLAIEEKFRGYENVVILNRIVSPIYQVVLTKISLFLPLGHIGLISSTQHDVTRRFDREIRIPFLRVK